MKFFIVYSAILAVAFSNPISPAALGALSAGVKLFENLPKPTNVNTQIHQSNDANVGIVRQAQAVEADGNYEWSYETENKIIAEEQGHLKSTGTEEAGEEAQGMFEYDSPEGQHFKITYIANENGFQPQGDHIPTPPPIPELILKALAWNEAHPEPEDAKYE